MHGMIFRNARIFTPDQGFVSGSFSVENGRFLDVCPGVDRPGNDLKQALVLPGLVDLHTHGAVGVEFSDSTAEDVIRMGRFLAGQGVTSFAPTSLTRPYDELRKAYAAALTVHRERPHDCARVLGIHMEGPFFSEAKKGAQNPAFLRKPDADAVRTLFKESGGLLKIVDVAPELDGAEGFIRQVSQFCTVSLAHTAAVYETAADAIEAGASHLTHLFNAMPPVHHRNPGVIGAASEAAGVTAELISDGLHVHPSAVRMAFRLFPERICLISDSLACCGLPDGPYESGGQPVLLRDGVARLTDETIAGSASTLFECLQRAISFGIDPGTAITAATLRPAQVLGCAHQVGSIEPGKLADFLICGEDYTLRQVYLGGKPIS